MSLDEVLIQKQLDILGVDQISAEVTELFLIILNVMILWLHRKMSLFLEMLDEVTWEKNYHNANNLLSNIQKKIGKTNMAQC